MSFDVSPSQFQQWIEQAGKLITDFYDQDLNNEVFAGKSPAEVQHLLDEPLPDDPENIDELLDEIGSKVLGTITNNVGPRYFGYITGGGNQVAVLGEMIKASLNQNNLKWHYCSLQYLVLFLRIFPCLLYRLTMELFLQ